jgi:alcohol dehydrogenase YqhD (iron-dependent ADH family)
VHDFGHVLSVLFDTPHGVTLSRVYPAWLKYHKEKIPERITELGKNAFNAHDIDSTIKNIETFFRSLESPVRLEEAGIKSADKELILSTMIKNKVNGMHHKLNPESIEKIIDFMYLD